MSILIQGALPDTYEPWVNTYIAVRQIDNRAKGIKAFLSYNDKGDGKEKLKSEIERKEMQDMCTAIFFIRPKMKAK